MRGIPPPVTMQGAIGMGWYVMSSNATLVCSPTGTGKEKRTVRKEQKRITSVVKHRISPFYFFAVYVRRGCYLVLGSVRGVC